MRKGVARGAGAETGASWGAGAAQGAETGNGDTEAMGRSGNSEATSSTADWATATSTEAGWAAATSSGINTLRENKKHLGLMRGGAQTGGADNKGTGPGRRHRTTTKAHGIRKQKGTWLQQRGRNRHTQRDKRRIRDIFSQTGMEWTFIRVLRY